MLEDFKVNKKGKIMVCCKVFKKETPNAILWRLSNLKNKKGLRLVFIFILLIELAFRVTDTHWDFIEKLFLLKKDKNC